MGAIDPFGAELNKLLVSTYQMIIKIEEAMLSNMSNGNITISEMHTIECIGQRLDEGTTVTEIAQEMSITLPSVTVSVKKLERKGLVTKQRSNGDARRIVIKLTKEGKKADIAHRYFHRQMVHAVAKSVTEDEKQVLLSATQSINEFFKQKLQELQSIPVKGDDNS